MTFTTRLISPDGVLLRRIPKIIADKEIYYRWVLVNLHETCYMQVDMLIDGWYATREEALASINYTSECFAAWRLEFTATPRSELVAMKIIEPWEMTNKTISFGKHQGKDYNIICCEDPTYLAWAAGEGLVEKDNPYVRWSIRAKANGQDCADDYDYRMDY